MTVSSVTPPSRRLFRRGCYTLAHDHELETLEEALDVTVTFMVPKAALKWDESDGGSIHYLQAGADEELLTVMPVPNAVTMVYRYVNDGIANIAELARSQLTMNQEKVKCFYSNCDYIVSHIGSVFCLYLCVFFRLCVVRWCCLDAV